MQRPPTTVVPQMRAPGALAQSEKRAINLIMEMTMELSVHTDKILNTIATINSHERDRASDAGEDRAEIGNLLELTGLNKKAFSFVRMLDKQEPEKREDILRSLNPLLDMMDSHWNGQGTADMFDDAPEAEPASPEAADDFSHHLADVAE